VPGRRIKLHPDDYYALGADRGGIDERWFSSTTPADNGPKTSPNEGLSFIVADETEKVLLRDAVSELGKDIIGERIWDRYGRWPVYSKFFDNKGALPFHIHHRDEHAELIHQLGKPEAYFFPTQLNNYGGDFPYTYFGLRPGITKDEVVQCLKDFKKGDNRITNLSVAYRLELGTGWDVPAGTLHAPGSLCTYEPQYASDVFAMYQSLTGDTVISEEFLWKDVPEEHKMDYQFLIDLIDWDINTDPDFAGSRFMKPRGVNPEEEMKAAGYQENWICYQSEYFSAKELTVFPGSTVTLRDAAAYGTIVLQGHGKMGVWDIEAPALIRFGQLTLDEFFVTEAEAQKGVVISNPSSTDPIVMLKHFGPGNPDLAA
jgi:hypothetical protein